MNLSDLEAECGRLLNDPSNTRWTTSVLTTRLNLAQAIVQGYTKAVKTKEILTATANTATLAVSASVLDILRVGWILPNGSKKKLDGITREELDFRYIGWENYGYGEPLNYWYDGSNHEINFVPAPGSADIVTNGVEVWEVLTPADLVDVTDIPFDSNSPMTPYHLSLVHWTVAQCWMDNGDADSLAKSKFHKSGLFDRPGEFEKQIMRIREEFDSPVDIPSRVMTRIQGGRISSRGRISKSYPFR